LRSIIYFVIGLSTILFVTAYMMPPVATEFSFPENRVWKHRQNNSVSAIKSIREGTSGIELDIMFIDGHLRVAHDPTEIANSQLLNRYLKDLADKNVTPTLWLDIKNIWFSNEVEIRTEILDLIERYGLYNRLLVESPRPMQMVRLCQTIIKCSIWAQKTHNPISRTWTRASVRAFSLVANLSSVSIDYKDASLAEKIVPNDFPVLLYTFSSKNQLAGFDQNPRFKVLLTD